MITLMETQKASNWQEAVEAAKASQKADYRGRNYFAAQTQWGGYIVGYKVRTKGHSNEHHVSMWDSAPASMLLKQG